MADLGSSTVTPTGPDWEVLSMSMTSSAFGNPSPAGYAKTDELSSSPEPSSENSGLQASGVVNSSTLAKTIQPTLSTEDGSKTLQPSTESQVSSPTYSQSYRSDLSVERDARSESSSGVSGKEAETALHGLSPKNNTKKKARKSASSRALWSLPIIVGICGVVMLGHCLHAEFHRNERLQLELTSKDEELNDLRYQITRLKEIFGGRYASSQMQGAGLA